MKILVVAPFLPSPPRFGGQRRIDGLLRSLAQRHEVSVLSFTATDEFTEMSLAATRSYCAKVVTFPDMEFVDRRDKRLLQARSLVSRHSFEHLLVARRVEFSRKLQELVDRDDYDIVQVEFMQMAAAAFARRPGRRYRTVLDEHNIEFDIIKRTADAEVSTARRVYSAIDWRKLRREERKAWRSFDGVSVTSERDGAIITQLEPATRVSVVPNGADVDHFSPPTTPCDADNLLFFGAMNYYPNNDGVHYFVREIFPLILKQRPNVKLWLVGPAPDDVKRLRSPNIEVTDFVDAVEPYIDRATAIVVPLRLGGGTRLKIVEAMAKGKAVISTRIGAEGIDVVDGESALLSDEPRGFANHVENVLADAALADRLGKAARKLAVDRYSWAALTANLERFYDELARTPAKS
jgi:glycosyltransferase involved in cell wall biosynthesis